MKKIIIIISIAFFSLTGYSQQDALFSQYMFNKLVVNPGYTGSREVFTGLLLGRTQWVGLDGAPQTFTLSMHSPLRNRKLGLGFYAFKDQIGPTDDIGFMGSFSYKIRLGQGKLSFGLQAGAKYFDINFDEENLRILDDNDVYANRGSIDQEDKLVPDVNFGMYYYTDRWYLGASVKHLLRNEHSNYQLLNGNQVISSYLLNHFFVMGGLAAPFSDNIVFVPSFLVKYVENAPLQLDVNASFLFNNTFQIGASYRSERAVVLMAQVFFNNFRLGYSYDIWMNELRVHNTGSHELMLGLDMGLGGSRMLTPRYF